MSGGATPLRSVRIDDELWEEAQRVAKAKGDNLSDIIRRALELYAEDKHPTWDDAPSIAASAHIANCPQCQTTFGGNA